MIDLILNLVEGRVISILLLIIIYLAFFFNRWKQKKYKKFILYTVMYIYICLVLAVTLMPFHLPIPSGVFPWRQAINLIPYNDLLNNHGAAKYEICLNILMMIPFGILLPMIKKQNLFTCTFFTLLFSTSIEAIQLLNKVYYIDTSRVCDITDLINNTIGGIIGFIIYTLIRKIYLVIRK